jgi:transcriptional regulator with XRE-family HTH domain
MKVLNNVVGSQVRYFRCRLDLTQEMLAARCNILGWNITRGKLAKIEAQVRCVSDAELYLLAKALKVGVEKLYPKSEEPILDLGGRLAP